MFKRLIASFVILCFSCNYIMMPQAKAAEGILNLPAAGTMVNLSPAYEPALIKGITIHRDNPFLFDFIIDRGNDTSLSFPNASVGNLKLKQEADRLIKYFFACLTIPEKDLWVNLSPYEKDRMIPKALGQTGLGRDLLAQDYILKQLTASLIYPEKNLGKEFWSRVYTKAQQMYGTSQVPVNTFNKVWIVADKATVYEHNQTAFVINGHLKVMLDEDYLALNRHSEEVQSTTEESKSVVRSFANAQDDRTHSLASNIVREIILPEIEKEVNTGKNFAMLRQIFNSQILAMWYKKNLKEALLNQVYTDKSTVNGVNLSDPSIKEKIYQQYLKAYKKGVFNYIKEDPILSSPNASSNLSSPNASVGDLVHGTIPRKYFSGGYSVNPAMLTTLKSLQTPEARNQLSKAMTGLKSALAILTVTLLTGNQPTAQATTSTAVPKAAVGGAYSGGAIVTDRFGRKYDFRDWYLNPYQDVWPGEFNDIRIQKRKLGQLGPYEMAAGFETYLPHQTLAEVYQMVGYEDKMSLQRAETVNLVSPTQDITNNTQILLPGYANLNVTLKPNTKLGDLSPEEQEMFTKGLAYNYSNVVIETLRGANTDITFVLIVPAHNDKELEDANKLAEHLKNLPTETPGDKDNPQSPSSPNNPSQAMINGGFFHNELLNHHHAAGRKLDLDQFKAIFFGGNSHVPREEIQALYEQYVKEHSSEAMTVKLEQREGGKEGISNADIVDLSSRREGDQQFNQRLETGELASIFEFLEQSFNPGELRRLRNALQIFHLSIASSRTIESCLREFGITADSGIYQRFSKLCKLFSKEENKSRAFYAYLRWILDGVDFYSNASETFNIDQKIIQANKQALKYLVEDLQRNRQTRVVFMTPGSDGSFQIRNRAEFDDIHFNFNFQTGQIDVSKSNLMAPSVAGNERTIVQVNKEGLILPIATHPNVARAISEYNQEVILKPAQLTPPPASKSGFANKFPSLARLIDNFRGRPASKAMINPKGTFARFVYGGLLTLMLAGMFINPHPSLKQFPKIEHFYMDPKFLFEEPKLGDVIPVYAKSADGNIYEFLRTLEVDDKGATNLVTTGFKQFTEGFPTNVVELPQELPTTEGSASPILQESPSTTATGVPTNNAQANQAMSFQKLQTPAAIILSLIVAFLSLRSTSFKAEATYIPDRFFHYPVPQPGDVIPVYVKTAGGNFEFNIYLNGTLHPRYGQLRRIEGPIPADSTMVRLPNRGALVMTLGGDKAMPYGGIDLTKTNSGMTVTKDANGGVKVDFDPALIARIKKYGIAKAVPMIIHVASISPAQIEPLLGYTH